MSKPLLLILSPGFPSDEQDDTCLPALRMFLREETIQAHFEVQVISMHYPFNKSKYLWHNIPVECLRGQNKKGWHRIPLYIKTWLSLKRHCPATRETMVLSIFATEAALLASHFCNRHKLRHFCWVMGQDARAENRFIALLGKNTHFIVMSEFLKQTFENNFKHKVLGLLPSALYLPDLPAYAEQKRNMDFICVGSLIPLKRVEWVLQLIRDLKNENLSAKACVVGEGPERNSLEALCKNYGISHLVHFTGKISHSQVLSEMMTSRILLHPSAFEGFGNIFLEALYSGCHVVSLFDPFNGKQKQMHKVQTYSEFYEKAKALLHEELTHTSIQYYTTKQSGELFIRLSQSVGDSL